MTATLGPEELLGHLEETAAVVLQGPPGTGKTRLAFQLVQWLANGRQALEGSPVDDEDVRRCQFTALRSDRPAAVSAPVVWEIVQLHPGYAYEDLVRGLAASGQDGTGFQPRDGIIVELAELARERGHDKPTILILDEINRCNLSAVLGELILVLEKGYRRLPVKLQYPAPEGGSETLTLPESLWILGTMNTADRSIAMVDFAIRRRFRFLDVLPSMDVLATVNPSEAVPASQQLFTLFRNLIAEADRDRLAIGHSYFIVAALTAGSKDWADTLARRVLFEVLPLAREYRQEGFITAGAPLSLAGVTVDVGRAAPPDGLTQSTLADWLRNGRG